MKSIQLLVYAEIQIDPKVFDHALKFRMSADQVQQQVTWDLLRGRKWNRGEQLKDLPSSMARIIFHDYGIHGEEEM